MFQESSTKINEIVNLLKLRLQLEMGQIVTCWMLTDNVIETLQIQRHAERHAPFTPHFGWKQRILTRAPDKKNLAESCLKAAALCTSHNKKTQSYKYWIHHLLSINEYLIVIYKASFPHEKSLG